MYCSAVVVGHLPTVLAQCAMAFLSGERFFLGLDIFISNIRCGESCAYEYRTLADGIDSSVDAEQRRRPHLSEVFTCLPRESSMCV
jgi:hypothetical protein